MTRIRTGAVVAVAAILFAACGGTATTSAPTTAPTTAPSAPGSTEPSVAPSAAIKQGGTLVVGLEGDINRTDPSLVDDLNSTYVAQQVVETLVTLKPGTGDQIVPALAESWAISPDGLTYTFKLRTGIKFHDGTDFNAEAVKFNFDRWLNIPKSYVDLSYTYYIDSVIGKGDTSKVASTAAPDPTTFSVTLREPNSAFLVQMTLTPFAIQSPKALTDGNASAPDFKDNKYATGGPPAMVGTGPFIFKEWVPADHVTLVKNADYWNKAAGGPYLDQITFKPYPETTARINAIQSGGIDLAETIAPLDVPTIQADTNLTVVDRGSACNAGVLGMNQKFKPFDNLKIRQAVAYAINRPEIVKAFFGGDFGLVLKNWTPPGTPFAKELTLPEYNPDKAKQLITESGVTDLSFDFWYPSDVTRAYLPDPKGMFDAMLTDLEAVGFKPNPKTAPWRPDYLAGWTGGKYAMFLGGWNCDWFGIDNFLYTAFFGYQNALPNPSYEYKNDAMNQAMLDALKSADPAVQKTNWEKAQDMILADMPAVPIGASKTPGAVANYVKGYTPSPTILEIFTNTWLDK
jgi:peptide/nickel transport system substrate-binding protein